MSTVDTDRIADMAAASTHSLRAYVARLRAIPSGLTAWQLRGLTLALNELDRRELPEVLCSVPGCTIRHPHEHMPEGVMYR